MSALTHEVLPGGLSGINTDVIFEFADRGWTAQKIAAQLLAHPSTVQWFMYRNGLLAPRYANRPPYIRNGRLVVAFSPEEDAYIEKLRVDGCGRTQIAKLTKAKFGHERSPVTIGMRLVMLAARAEEDGADADLDLDFSDKVRPRNSPALARER